jgi:hypothetical protein
LRVWLRDRAKDERVFRKMPRYPARTLRADLDATRTAWIKEAESDEEAASRRKSQFLRYVTEDGEYADFHSFRHTYISGIVASGASIKTAQTLARHSTVELTVGRYAHTRLDDLQGAVESLPSLVPLRPVGPETARATGTDGQRSDSSWGQMRGHLGRKTRPTEARIGKCVSNCLEVDPSPQPESQVVTVSSLGNKKATSGETWLGAEGTGLEPATGKPAPDFESAAEPQKQRENQACSAHCQQIASSDKNVPSDLQAIVLAWPHLPESIRSAIAVLVRASTSRQL